MSNGVNLDKIAADCARKIVGDVKSVVKKPYDTLETLSTKTLGVLQSQGVYAMILFLFSRSSDEQKIAPKILKNLYTALKSLPQFSQDKELNGFGENTEHDIVLDWFSKNILEDIDLLLLVRSLFEQALIYTRFGAKAEQKQGGTT